MTLEVSDPDIWRKKIVVLSIPLGNLMFVVVMSYMAVFFFKDKRYQPNHTDTSSRRDIMLRLIGTHTTMDTPVLRNPTQATALTTINHHGIPILRTLG